MIRRLVAAGAVIVAGLSGCSGEPAPLPFAKALPSCEAIASALAAQGMPSPSPAPPGTVAAAGSECSFVARPGAERPVLTSAVIHLSRPAVDTFDGKATPGWAADFDADNQCPGQAAADPTLPGGRSCYTRTADDAGQAKVTGYTARTGISVLLIRVGGGTPDTVRTETLATAGAVASAVAGML
ncbi:hypothetical protein GCM10010172_50860 [Paractinoplanes ferrugineus]|uniref:DUF3558 domain-containing protein n=1 Tax=Paractinoplanes ferrugineus TaxID=113564 RepID=A0A919MDS2_9ACTN|nr:hypothetical protein [Actinoplanes ferrugineus]GIE16096.1 hypothetical protein Afe05nite_79360 [Actinoplanes ferrugineus]